MMPARPLVRTRADHPCPGITSRPPRFHVTGQAAAALDHRRCSTTELRSIWTVHDAAHPGGPSLIGVDDYVAGERELLEAMLDVQREAIAELLSDLDDGAARARLVPSLTTPLSLVKHATFVEKVWFHSRVGGVSRADLGLPETVDESFLLKPEDTIDSVRAAFHAACEHSRSVAAEHQLDEQVPWHRGPVSVRFIYLHMIAELARHAGHGDILVEQLRAGAGSGGHPLTRS